MTFQSPLNQLFPTRCYRQVDPLIGWLERTLTWDPRDRELGHCATRVPFILPGWNTFLPGFSLLVCCFVLLLCIYLHISPGGKRLVPFHVESLGFVFPLPCLEHRSYCFESLRTRLSELCLCGLRQSLALGAAGKGEAFLAVMKRGTGD